MDNDSVAEPAIEGIPYLLGQLGNVAVRGIKEALRPFALHPRHTRTLMWVAAHPGISQQALAEFLSVHRSAMVTLIDELERNELVTREASESDRRMHALHLTPKGHALIKDFMPVVRNYEKWFLEALTPNEARQLLRALEKLSRVHGIALPPALPAEEGD